MASELKSKTARINGAESHGPKTEAGKQISAQNALTHGFTARQRGFTSSTKTLILECESPDDFQQMLAEHNAIHEPVTAPEKELVEQMAVARWRIRRFVASETILIDCEMARNHAAVTNEFAPPDSHVHLALAIRSLADQSNSLALISRYESRLQRIHDRAYTALRELQKARISTPPPEPAPVYAQSGPPVESENKKWQNEPTDHPSPVVATLKSSAIHLCLPAPGQETEIPLGPGDDLAGGAIPEGGI